MRQEFQVSIVSPLPVSNRQLESIRYETNNDTGMAALHRYLSTE